MNPKSFNHASVKSKLWGWSNRLKYNSVSDENIASLELYFINWLRININNFTKINNYSDGDKEHAIKYLVYWVSVSLYASIFFYDNKSPCVTSEPIRCQRGLYVLTGFEGSKQWSLWSDPKIPGRLPKLRMC